MTFGALGLRGLSGQLTLTADGKQFRVAFDQGVINGAVSPLASDAAVRLALTMNLVTSSQVADITRRMAAQPGGDEIDMLVQYARLSPDAAPRLRRRLVAQRAARTFAYERGDFIVEDSVSIPTVPGGELDVRTIAYLGAKTNLSDERLANELAQLGSFYVLKPSAYGDLRQFGFTPAEQPVLDMVMEGAYVDEIVAAHPNIGERNVRAVIYALASCSALELGAPPRSPRALTPSSSPTSRTDLDAPTNLRAQRPPSQSGPTQPSQGGSGAYRMPSQGGQAPSQGGSGAYRMPSQGGQAPSQGGSGAYRMPSQGGPARAPSQTGTPWQAGSGPTSSGTPWSGNAPPGQIPTMPRTPTPASGPNVGRTPTPASGPNVGRTPTPGSGPTMSRVPTQRSGPYATTNSSSPVVSPTPARAHTPTGAASPPAISRTVSSSRAKSTTTPPPGTEDIVRMRPPTGAPPMPTNSMNAATQQIRKPVAPARRARRDSTAANEIEALLANKMPLLDRGVDHFTLLGLSLDASAADIRSAYFTLARKLHPDRLAAIGLDDDERRAQRLMAQVNLAFAVLNDNAKRDEYLSVMRRGGEAAVKAEEAKADEMAMAIMRAEEAFKQGEMALRRDQLPQAIEAFQMAVELQPKEAEYQALLAWAQFAAAPDKNAVAGATRKALQRAAETNDRLTSARFYLGRVERMLGREREALQYFEEVLAIKPSHTEAASEARILKQRLGKK
jgi:curved DNA-binding protein CbpA